MRLVFYIQELEKIAHLRSCEFARFWDILFEANVLFRGVGTNHRTSLKQSQDKGLKPFQSMNLFSGR